VTERARIWPRFKGRRPEELPELLERFVDELEQEVRALRLLLREKWDIAAAAIVPASGTVTLSWQTAHLCDSSSADVAVRLPHGRRDNLGQRVRIVKTSASNAVIVYPSGGQHVAGAASQSLSGAGVREYQWTGDTAARGWRLVA
jgi:hypothetical protein